MKLVSDSTRVVNVGAAQLMIILTASTSSSDHSAPIIFSLFNDEKGGETANSVSGSTLANPTSVRVSDSRWQNEEKRDSGKYIVFSKWRAVRVGRPKRFSTIDLGVPGLFQLN